MRVLNTVTEKKWFALYTKPRCEFKAKNQLDYINTQNYLPLCTRTARWSDRIKKIQEPLFRSYIFIFANEKERLLSLEQSSIVKCICQCGRAACIPNWQIENLQRIEENHLDFQSFNGLVTGKQVKIIGGPLKGLIGTVEKLGGRNLLVLSVDLLNRSILVHLSDQNIVNLI